MKYESIMMDQFGILPRTCAAYVKSMQALGLIKFEGFTAVWIGGNTEGVTQCSGSGKSISPRSGTGIKTG